MGLAADIETLERILIDALSAVGADTVATTRDSDISHLVDSLGLVMALANLQDALGFTLEPDEIIDVFQCRAIADVVEVLRAAQATRLTPQD